ncbi:carboxymuconolactone decarboxylase family protein [Streptomyces sp. NPDC002755]|uniref:carboxymuconolactone decarboxylase family protein n=1 Tax=Streptomyces sp. NPDC002884 TaxID=3154544 RepID=UPI00331901FB
MGSRIPNPVTLVPELAEVAGALRKAGANGSVPQTTIGLIHLRTGQLLGNTYAALRNAAALREAGESQERIAAVATWWDAPYFTDAERAALELAEAVLQPSSWGERVSDELYTEVARHYDDMAIATLALVIGQAGFWGAFALIGKPVPGVGPAEQWT